MKPGTVIAERSDKTIYRDGDACIKVFNDGYSKADVFNEALNQARIEETGLNIPKVREVTMIDGKWAIVSDFISGKTLQQLIDEDGKNKEKYIGMLVELQLKVHSAESPLLGKLKDKMNIRICQSDLDATTRFDLHMRLEGMPKDNKVCHGDFSPSNIIITEEGTAYILDWSHASQGNASADAARTYLLFLRQGDTDGAESYLDLFCEKSGTAKQYVHKWIPIVAASESVKGDEKEREYLLSRVNDVDYEK